MEMTTAKTVAVFAIIVGCFIVLYPKIFHPMILHIFGMAPAKRSVDDLSTRMPPHLRHAMASGKRGSVREDIPSHMRAGAHPGMRAAAEMKKAAVQQSATGDKGMMGVVLPMYAIGIVLYLLYTLSKVFGRKDKGDGSSTGDYLSNHFADMQPNTASSTAGGAHVAAERKALQKQKELEKLLMKAESEDINDNEMTELKRRLLETEAQMSRILQAMEAVQQKVGATTEGCHDVGDDDAAGVEDVDNAFNSNRQSHLGVNNVQVFDDEADCPEDDSDGELELELDDLDDLDQGDRYDDEAQQTTTPPPPHSGKVQNGVRIPPPNDQRRNFSSLADQLGKPSVEQCSDEVLNEDIGCESEKWKEMNVRHRTAASAAARRVDC